ncbi:MAG: Hsp70 family protein [Proteobacteria bacterium]|nr:Hsp70 family protein [Pseudomonadota bacterium]
MKKIGIGIDFGTTNSLAAVWGTDVSRSNKIPIAFWLRDEEFGNRPHPSVVWLKPDDSVVVGAQARRSMRELSGTIGHTFIRSVKRSISSNAEWMHGGRRFQPYEIGSEIFKHLKQDGQKNPIMLGHKFESCVVTIPVGFNGEQRRGVRRSMEKAGLLLSGFVHEPFAAMVAHFYHPERKLSSLRGKRILVFDWGGGTLDICLVEGSQDGATLFELSHDGIADRAGDDFDHRIMAELQNRFLEKNRGMTIDDIITRCRAKDRFWINSELAKIELSKYECVEVNVLNFLDGNPPFDLEEKVTRSEFEKMIDREINAACACALRCVEKARLTPASIDYVLMVGGTSLIPRVRWQIEQIFGAKTSVTHEPDAAIARGAAIVAAEEWCPVNANTLGLEMARGEFFTLLEKGEKLIKENSKKYVFFCTDPRDGKANFIFSQKRNGSSQSIPTGEILQVPIENERPSHFRDLDRLILNASITEDCTLLVEVQHSGMGSVARHEVADLSFGLKLN